MPSFSPFLILSVLVPSSDPGKRSQRAGTWNLRASWTLRRPTLGSLWVNPFPWGQRSQGQGGFPTKAQRPPYNWNFSKALGLILARLPWYLLSKAGHRTVCQGPGQGTGWGIGGEGHQSGHLEGVGQDGTGSWACCPFALWKGQRGGRARGLDASWQWPARPLLPCSAVDTWGTDDSKFELDLPGHHEDNVPGYEIRHILFRSLMA